MNENKMRNINIFENNKRINFETIRIYNKTEDEKKNFEK